MNVPSLWPELQSHAQVSPLGILRSQALWLQKKTGGLLWGEIQTDSNDGQFSHRFFVAVPALGDYRHELFSMQQGIEYYPVTMRRGSDTNRKKQKIHNDQELLAWLKMAFEEEKPILDRLYTDSLPESERMTSAR